MFDGPDGRQNLQDFGLPDVRNRHPAYFRKSLLSQRIDLLLGMLGVLPGGEALDVNGAGDFFEAGYQDILVELGVHPLPCEPSTLESSISGDV